MEPVKQAIEAATLVDTLGVPAILALFCFWLGYLYLTERKKVEKMTDRLFKEMAENSKHMTLAVADVEKAIQGFKSTLDNIRPFLAREP